MKFLIYVGFQFEDPRDADDAIRGRDGYNFDGNRLRVSYELYRLFVMISNWNLDLLFSLPFLLLLNLHMSGH